MILKPTIKPFFYILPILAPFTAVLLPFCGYSGLFCKVFSVSEVNYNRFEKALTGLLW